MGKNCFANQKSSSVPLFFHARPQGGRWRERPGPPILSLVRCLFCLHLSPGSLVLPGVSFPGISRLWVSGLPSPTLQTTGLSKELPPDRLPHPLTVGRAHLLHPQLWPLRGPPARQHPAVQRGGRHFREHCPVGAGGRAAAGPGAVPHGESSCLPSLCAPPPPGTLRKQA